MITLINQSLTYDLVLWEYYYNQSCKKTVHMNGGFDTSKFNFLCSYSIQSWGSTLEYVKDNILVESYHVALELSVINNI